jgi:transporter family protein
MTPSPAREGVLSYIVRDRYAVAGGGAGRSLGTINKFLLSLGHMLNIPSWLAYALISAFFAALTAIFAKVGLKDVNSDLATAVRTAVVLLITWGIVLYRGHGREIAGLSRNNWLFLVLSAIATGLSWLFYYRALQLGRVSDVSVIDKGSIVLTILLSVLFLREPLTPRIVIAAVLIFAGMIVLVWK